MDKKTQTWLEMARNDLAFAATIIKNKQRPFYAAHFCHQAVEKILKAFVQHRTGEAPPRTHNFKILCEVAKLDLPDDKKEFLQRLAPNYIGTRYPEDIEELYKQYTEDYVKRLFSQTEELFTWLEPRLT